MGKEPIRYGEYGGRKAQCKKVVADRLREAGLGTRRFIHLNTGSKVSHDHTLLRPRSIRGDYGVYAGGGLVGLDIDDYEPETPALDELPPTFTVQTAHDGEHRYYRVTDSPVKRLRVLTDGAGNASLRWGEIHARGKYLVGPGSEIDRCDRKGCLTHGENNGEYIIEEDRPITTISSERIEEIMLNDPSFEDDTAQRLLDDYGETSGTRRVDGLDESGRSSSSGRAKKGGEERGEQSRMDSFSADSR
ncbi:MAG: bifunctional DNA primase/polymerase [Halobacteriales archaeon]|nr:bifunctional DNA primase/polymerase [Halobacteriales archaeon]